MALGDEPTTAPAAPPIEAAPPTRQDPLRDALRPTPGGLTFESVAKEAVASSPQVRMKTQELESSEGAVSQTVVAFFPRLTLAASYTRVSEVEGGGLGGALVGAANEGLLGVAPCPGAPAASCVVDSAGTPVGARAVNLGQIIPNQYQFSAGLTVPISDYFFRAVQAYNAAEHNQAALEMQVDAQRLTAAAEAKLALLGWALAKGQVVVARRSVGQAQKQLKDVEATLLAEKASKVDLLRVQALVAQNEFALADAESAAFMAEHRLRTLVHASPDRALALGVDIFEPPTLPELSSMDEALREAIANRLEILSVEESAAALSSAEATVEASYYPRLDGFANLLVANPNPRIFPSTEEFNTTWDVGLRLSWTVNDTFATLGGAAQARARTRQLDATKQQLVDAVRMEITQAFADIQKAKPSIEAADRGSLAANETYRVTQTLFSLGQTTGTALADADGAVTAAELRRLAAYASLQSARIRLDHALGRDRDKADRAQ